LHLEGSQALPASPSDRVGVDLRVLFNFELSILLFVDVIGVGGGALYGNIIRYLAKILIVTVGRAACEACSARSTRFSSSLYNGTDRIENIVSYSSSVAAHARVGAVT
jgi:hypothetical protein